LLALAAERGEVRLDDPVARHLPAGTMVPSRGGQQITLERLAAHTAGLPRLPPGLLGYAIRHRDDPYARLMTQDVLDALAETRLRRTPGARSRYSNFGAGVLGIALEHAAGERYETLVRERIGDPLGLRDTTITLSDEQRSRFVQGTTRRGSPTGPWSFPGMPGAGALRSTASDLLAFARAQLGATPGDAPSELARAIAATHVERARAGALTPALRIGLGWMMIPVGRERVPTLWHDGGTGGFRTYIGLAPEHGNAVVVLSSTAKRVDQIGARALLALST
jgi:CubicO group peptidase (beta-lactamase class C family)